MREVGEPVGLDVVFVGVKVALVGVIVGISTGDFDGSLVSSKVGIMVGSDVC